MKSLTGLYAVALGFALPIAAQDDISTSRREVLISDYLRRAEAQVASGSSEGVRTLVDQVLQLDPKNEQGRALLNQVNARVLRAVSLFDIARRPGVSRTPPLPPFVPTGYDQGVKGHLMDYLEGEPVRVSVDSLIDVARGQDDSVSIDLVGSTAFLAGPDAAVQASQRILEFLSASMTAEISVDAALFRVTNAGGARPTIIRSFTGDLTNYGQDLGLTPLWSSTGVVRSGYSVSLAQERYEHVVHDFDVEVAQDSKIGDPLVHAMFEGVSVAVVPHRLSGSSDIVVGAQVAIGERRRPIDDRVQGAHEYPSLDVPVINTNAAAMSGRVPSGGVLMAWFDGDPIAGGRYALAIRVTASEAPSQRDGALGAYPISALVSPLFSRRAHNPSSSRAEYEEGSKSSLPISTAKAERPFGVTDRDQLHFQAESVLGELFEQEGVSIQVMGNHLVIRGPDEVHRRVSSMLGNFETQWIQQSEISLATRAGAPSAAVGVFAPRASTESLVWHSVSLPALLGRPHLIMRGIESTAIVDYDVEVAQEASAMNPVIQGTFGGISCSFVPFARGQNLAVDLDMSVSWINEARRRPVDAKINADLYPVSLRRVRFEDVRNVTRGQAVTLGDGPTVGDGAGSRRTSQVMVIR